MEIDSLTNMIESGGVPTQPVESYVCPSDESTLEDPLENPFSVSYALSGHTEEFVPGETDLNLLVDSTGFFHANKSAKLAEIVDGTSNTFMFGERHGNIADFDGMYDHSLSRLRLVAPVSLGDHNPHMFFGAATELADLNLGISGAEVPPEFWGISISRHDRNAQGGNMLYVDGRVEYLNVSQFNDADVKFLKAGITAAGFDNGIEE